MRSSLPGAGIHSASVLIEPSACPVLSYTIRLLSKLLGRSHPQIGVVAGALFISTSSMPFRTESAASQRKFSRAGGEKRAAGR